MSRAAVTKFPRARIGARRLATIRIAELRQLARFRHEFGIALSGANWVYTIACILASAPAGVMRVHQQGRAISWPSLQLEKLRQEVALCGLPTFSDAELETIMDAVWRMPTARLKAAMRSDALAKLLCVTAEERWAAEIRTIRAIDESRQERKARQKLERRARDVERIRTKRAGTCKPRAQFLAESLSAQKPWEMEGISRATWFRNRKRSGSETSASPDQIYIGGATDLSHAKNVA